MCGRACSTRYLLSTINDRNSQRPFQKRIAKRLAKEQARTALEHDFPKLAKATSEQIPY